MEIRVCYQVLELSPRASQSELRQAYKDMVQVWHPDRFSHSPRLRLKAETKLVEINRAYETLCRLLEQRDRLQACFAEQEKTIATEVAVGHPSGFSTEQAAPATGVSESRWGSRSAPGSTPGSTSGSTPGSTPGSMPGAAAGAAAQTAATAHSQSRPFRRRSRPPRSRADRAAAYRPMAYRSGPGLTLRWFFTTLMLSIGVILLMLTPFALAYLVAQQPGWFLLPAVAGVGLYGYQVLRVR